MYFPSVVPPSRCSPVHGLVKEEELARRSEEANCHRQTPDSDDDDGDGDVNDDSGGDDIMMMMVVARMILGR